MSASDMEKPWESLGTDIFYIVVISGGAGVFIGYDIGTYGFQFNLNYFGVVRYRSHQEGKTWSSWKNIVG